MTWRRWIDGFFWALMGTAMFKALDAFGEHDPNNDSFLPIVAVFFATWAPFSYGPIKHLNILEERRNRNQMSRSCLIVVILIILGQCGLIIAMSEYLENQTRFVVIYIVFLYIAAFGVLLSFICYKAANKTQLQNAPEEWIWFKLNVTIASLLALVLFGFWLATGEVKIPAQLLAIVAIFRSILDVTLGSRMYSD